MFETTHLANFRFQSKPQRGFTLQELIISLAIGSGVTAMASGLYNLVQEGKTITSVNELVAHLSLARSEAVKSGEQLVICPSTDGTECTKPSTGFNWWHNGAIMFVDTNGDRERDADEQITRAFAPFSGITIKTSSGSRRVAYMASGLTAVTNMTFTFCDARGTAAARYVVVSRSGRARVSKTPPDGRADAPHEICA